MVHGSRCEKNCAAAFLHAVLINYQQTKSFSETAKILGISPGTVCNYIHRRETIPRPHSTSPSKMIIAKEALENPDSYLKEIQGSIQ